MISDSFNLINLTLYIFSKDNDKHFSWFNDLLNLLRIHLEYLHVLYENINIQATELNLDVWYDDMKD